MQHIYLQDDIQALVIYLHNCDTRIIIKVHSVTALIILVVDTDPDFEYWPIVNRYSANALF